MFNGNSPVVYTKGFYLAKKVNGWNYCLSSETLKFLSGVTVYCSFSCEREPKKLNEQMFCSNCLDYNFCSRLQIAESSIDPENNIVVHNFYYNGKLGQVQEINAKNYRLCNTCQSCFILYGNASRESFLQLKSLKKRNKKQYLFNIVWTLNNSEIWMYLPKEVRMIIFQIGVNIKI